ncbi:MAG: hypothetical protein J6C19_08335 [Lachnospiraceae bacterium]|nr:hypothetical protein [Lachnospiraceae bacterium]
MEEDGKIVQFIFRGDEVVTEEKDSNLIRFIRGYDLIASDTENARIYYQEDTAGAVRPGDRRRRRLGQGRNADIKEAASTESPAKAGICLNALRVRPQWKLYPYLPARRWRTPA